MNPSVPEWENPRQGKRTPQQGPHAMRSSFGCVSSVPHSSLLLIDFALSLSDAGTQKNCPGRLTRLEFITTLAELPAISLLAPDSKASDLGHQLKSAGRRGYYLHLTVTWVRFPSQEQHPY
jgi:hypothetical protein